MVMLRRLLVATDGSASSERAARFAGRLASRFDASLDALSVVPRASTLVPAWIGGPPELPLSSIGAGAVVDEAYRISKQAATTAGRQGCRETAWSVEIGDPAHTIVSVADVNGADVIVMGRRGTGNVTGLLLGSVSTKVSHLTDRTVATVRGENGADVERILAAVDGSEHSVRAVDLAVTLANAYDAELHFLFVVSMTTMVPFGLGGVDSFEYGRLEDSLRITGEQYLLEAQKAASEANRQATVAIELGDPASHIVSHAADIGADLICIGRRGLGNVKGLLLGSVSHTVAHLAERTVITVR